MNHLESLTTEWLDYNGYFTRSAIKVGRRERGGWDGELDVIGYHPESKHFLHVECSMDALTWEKREEKFARKLGMGREYARKHFSGLELPDRLDQVVLLGFVSAVEAHRSIGGGRLVSMWELVAEITSRLPPNLSRSAVPESFPFFERSSSQWRVAPGLHLPRSR